MRFCWYSLGSVPGTSCTRERYDMPTIATTHPGSSPASNSTHSTAAKWVQRAIMMVTQVEEAVRPLLCRLVPLLFLPRRCGHQIWESGARMPLPMHQCPRVRSDSALRGLERLERDRLGHADPLMRLLAGRSMRTGDDAGAPDDGTLHSNQRDATLISPEISGRQLWIRGPSCLLCRSLLC
jgi:hypothetical protein